METTPIERVEALLRSMLSHQIAFNQSLPLVLGIDEEKHKEFLENYNKIFYESLEFYKKEAHKMVYEE